LGLKKASDMSLGAKIAIALFALLFGGVMFLHGTTADPDKAWFSYAFGAFCLLIAAALLLKGRVAEFCGSVVACGVLAAGVWYLITELNSGPIVGSESIINAARFLLAFGLPAALYLMKARFGVHELEAQQGVPADRTRPAGESGR
jgi:hypothetical protein